jgi:hypothetical protein
VSECDREASTGAGPGTAEAVAPWEGGGGSSILQLLPVTCFKTCERIRIQCFLLSTVVGKCTLITSCPINFAFLLDTELTHDTNIHPSCSQIRVDANVRRHNINKQTQSITTKSFLCGPTAQIVPRQLIFEVSVSHTIRHTAGRTPPYEGSDLRRGRYPHNTPATTTTQETNIHVLSGNSNPRSHEKSGRRLRFRLQ